MTEKDREIQSQTTLESKGPVGQGDYVINASECLESIAQDHGLKWETIWDDPKNAELKRIRKDPNVLLAGDRLHIPKRRLKEESGTTGQRHRFRRLGVPSHLKIIIKRFDEPWANERYIIDIDGDLREGTTNEEGLLDEPIPPNAESAVVTIAPDTDDELTYEFDLGGMDPISELIGVQDRLANLGFDCPLSGELDESTRIAISQFQEKHELEVTGEPDDATRNHLIEDHGN